MEGQRRKSTGGRRRRRKGRNETRKPQQDSQVVLIAARRPDSPRIVNGARRRTAASAVPRTPGSKRSPQVDPNPADPRLEMTPVQPAPRRAARIVRLPSGTGDERERERQRLLTRLLHGEGRAAISRAVNEYLASGFELPEEQEVQLQILEHFDEERVREGILAMRRLLESQTPIKKPILAQRLRRIEEYADEPATRMLATELRRSIRL